jgi:hypothetical protein
MKPCDTHSIRSLDRLSVVAGFTTMLTTLYFFAANLLL